MNRIENVVSDRVFFFSSSRSKKKEIKKTQIVMLDNKYDETRIFTVSTHKKISREENQFNFVEKIFKNFVYPYECHT